MLPKLETARRVIALTDDRPRSLHVRSQGLTAGRWPYHDGVRVAVPTLTGDGPMIATYQAACPPELWAYLDHAGIITGQAERALAAALRRGEPLNDLKRSFQRRFGINARQFHAIRICLDGK